MVSGRGEAEKLLEEMIEAQRRRLVELAARILPDATAEDLLQPHDHKALAGHPEFNFEDGILAGYLAVRTALRAEASSCHSEERSDEESAPVSRELDSSLRSE